MNLTFRDTDDNYCAQLLRLRIHLVFLRRTNSLINIRFKSEVSISLEGRSTVPITIYNEKLLIIHANS